MVVISREQMCMIILREAFDKQLCFVQLLFTIIKEFPYKDIYGGEERSSESMQLRSFNSWRGEVQREPFYKDFFVVVGKQEDIAHIHNLVINVYGENQAVVENVSVSGEVILSTKQQWVWDGIDHWKKHNFTNQGASMEGFSSEILGG